MLIQVRERIFTQTGEVICNMSEIYKNVRIKIESEHSELSEESLERYINDFMTAFDDDHAESLSKGEAFDDSEKTEMAVEGTIRENDGRIFINYEESELTDMQGAKTTLTFRKNSPDLVTMMRTGSVKTALVFEKRIRHICTYNVEGLMPFEVCVYTISLDNRIETEGKLHIDYIVEIQGTRAGRFKLDISVTESSDAPNFN